MGLGLGGAGCSLGCWGGSSDPPPPGQVGSFPEKITKQKTSLIPRRICLISPRSPSSSSPFPQHRGALSPNPPNDPKGGQGNVPFSLGDAAAPFHPGPPFLCPMAQRSCLFLFAEAINCLIRAIEIYTDMVRLPPTPRCRRCVPVLSGALPAGPLHHRCQTSHLHRRDLRGRAGGH